MLSLIIILSIAIAIAIGYKTGINTGLFAMAFAYLIGCFGLNLKAKDIINMWPLSIFFVIFAVSLFYNFAQLNGTLEKVANHLLYACRKHPKVLPYAIYIAATIIAALGAGFFTVLACMAPITLILCDKTGLNKMVGSVAANYGALAGANFMTSQSGIIFRGLMEKVGLGDNSFAYATCISATTFIIPFVVISFLMLVTNNKSLEGELDIAKPEPFDSKQRTTLNLIVLMVIIVLAGPLLNMFLPGVKTIAFINSKLDIGLIAIVFAIIALLLNLGDQKQAIAKVPWNTIIMICGVGMLISVAIKAGTIKLLANLVTSNLSPFLVTVIMTIVGSIMSFFSSTLGVVCPTLFPIVPTIAKTSALNPMLIFTAIVIGAQATAISPFSSGGALMLGSCSNDTERKQLFYDLIFKAVPTCVCGSMIFSIALYFILG